MIAPTNRRVGKQKIPRETLATSPDFDPNDPERELRDSFVPSDDERASGVASPPPLVPPRKSRNLARAMAIVRAAAGAALVVTVSSGVAWAARRYVMTSPRFGVTEIVVSGGARRTQDDIAREAGLAIGENVFSVDLDDARAKLIADPWIREAALARRLPGTLIVEVSEREAAAVVALGGSASGGGNSGDTYLVSRDGDVIKRLEAGDPSDFPVITGITPEALTEDREGVTRTLRRALDLAGDYEHGPLARRAVLQEIHVGVDGAITLVVGKSGLALVLGDPPFRRKLDQAARVMNELEKQGAKADAVMLDNEARPERVVVRMR